MAMDAGDYAAVIGFALLAVFARVSDVEGPVLAAAVGGFALAFSGWRLYAGRAWEALGWLAWVGAATILALGPAGDPLAFLGFLLLLILGVGFLFAERFELLADVWSADPEGDAPE